MNKPQITFALSFLVFTMFLLNGCGSSSSSTPKGSSLVTVTISSSGKSASLNIRQATVFARAGLKLRAALRSSLAIAAGVPVEVNIIRITVEASDMNTIVRTIPVQVGQQVVTDTFEVPNGLRRLFTVDALDSGSNIVFRSQANAPLDGASINVPCDLQVVVPGKPLFKGTLMGTYTGCITGSFSLTVSSDGIVAGYVDASSNRLTGMVQGDGKLSGYELSNLAYWQGAVTNNGTVNSIVGTWSSSPTCTGSFSGTAPTPPTPPLPTGSGGGSGGGLKVN
jgi:hypothetical protein